MVLELYNTLTRKKAPFVPIDAQNVRMYVCGPTVYDFAHIGNARPVIVFDVLYRLLRHLYGESHVTYVRNITDVDDKINARALRDFPGLPLNDAIARVTEKTANQFHADVAALGCLKPTVEPRATDNITQMIAIIVQLIAKGHAYVAAGEVLFDCASMPDYGQLSNRKLDEQQAGARVEVDAHKKNPGDFVLWKLSSPEEPGWESPWGRGRPGWHIECSAMSERYLGQTFDIHGGGLDLIFPHHENEIAQSRCAHGTPAMANVWMHNGFLQVEGEKMSKSLGNFVTINELLETTKFGGQKWPGEVLRLAMLMTHYRQPIDWTVERLNEAQAVFHRLNEITGELPIDLLGGPPSAALVASLADDLNTPAAIALMQEACRQNKHDEAEAAQILANMVMLGCAPTLESSLDTMRKVREALEGAKDSRINLTDLFRRLYGMGSIGRTRPGLIDYVAALQVSNPLTDFIKYAAPGMTWGVMKDLIESIDPKQLNDNIENRLAARKAKDFKESDRIRDELAGMGIALKDSKDPKTGEIVTTWEVAR